MARGTALGAALALGLASLGVVAAGCGGGGGSAHAGTSAFQAFESCLKSHGVTLPSRPRGQGAPPDTGTTSTGTTPSRPRGGFGFFRRNLTPAQQKAFQACRGKLPNGGRFGPGTRRPGGGNNPAFARYTQCLAKHGVKFGAAGQSGSVFRKAQAACRSLLPAPGTGTTTGTTGSG
jgi:hypothetical protein